MERKEMSAEDATALHVKNFIDCSAFAKERRRGHRSRSSLERRRAPRQHRLFAPVHKILWDAAKEQIIGDAEASKLLARKARKPWDLI
jgi:hypothetical protein